MSDATETEYDVHVGAPYRYAMTMPEMYEGWLEVTVDDTASPDNARYSPETLDAAMRAFCEVLNGVSPIEVTKRATASARRPGVFFPAE
ncbi:hypothetical protein [Nocardiopsis baichengensis]|uniref:hypothetical protein n=1 Tax=Nocardiopsis baichengensis TaxID=280240 RepID=UPI000347A64A|nr:hypothetical protein [Nocardiopsis baichengensis]